MGFLRFLLILVILGALGYGGWYWWQQRAEKLQTAQAESNAEPTPTPEPKIDPARTELDAIWEQYNAGEIAEARQALREYEKKYRIHRLIWEAQDLLGKINSKLLFGPGEYEGESAYTVSSGDTLSKISAGQDTTVDFLLLANNLDSTLIRIGQRLQVMPATFSLRIDVPNQVVFLENDGKFFRYYPFEEKNLPGAATGTETGEVLRKMAWREGEQVPPGTEGYLDSMRWVMISVDSITLYNEAEEAASAEASPTPESSAEEEQEDTQGPTKPTGQTIKLTSEAMQEICALVSTGNRVTVKFSAEE